MRHNFVRNGLWCLFGVLLFTAGFTVLRACDFSLRPLFDLQYCVSLARNDTLGLESSRARNLEARIHEAELRLAEKPACPKPPPTSKPSPKPVPAPHPPEPKADEEEQLKIPEKSEMTCRTGEDQKASCDTEIFGVSCVVLSKI